MTSPLATSLGFLALALANEALEQKKPVLYTQEQKIANVYHLSAIGDAQGRVTEFIKTTDEIFTRYPKGIRSFNDFHKTDWQNIPYCFQPAMLASRGIAPYTDDTRMALLVSEVLIESKKKQWDLEKTMTEMTRSFVKDMNDKTYGWAAPFRAPGNACLKGVQSAQRKMGQRATGTHRWWDAQAEQAGGCGSVMRAFPFGLVFSDDIQKAKVWAVEHSKITHGHPIALAACAAMAVGIAHAMNSSEDNEQIIETMITAAHEYDVTTAQKMRAAVAYAKKARKQLVSYDSIYTALSDKRFRSFHDSVFNKFQAWAADDAIAAAVYVWTLYPSDYKSALYVSVHTPGDSDSIAAMAGALVGSYARSGWMDPALVNWVEDTKRMKELAHQIASIHGV